MKRHLYFLIIIVFFYGSCISWKDTMHTKGDQNDAIQNAITDFLNSDGLSRIDTVYSVHLKDVSNKILGVWIFGIRDKLLPGPNTKIGTSHPGFPTRYLEKGGKLFYWYDSTQNITPGLISVLSKYKCIDSLNVNGFVGIPDGRINDAKKAIDYYFCKCNLRKYKKVHTRIAMGGYVPPKLICDCDSW